jgi:hypothetical protein
MTELRKGIRDYLMLRRGLGFQLVKHKARSGRIVKVFAHG